MNLSCLSKVNECTFDSAELRQQCDPPSSRCPVPTFTRPHLDIACLAQLQCSLGSPNPPPNPITLCSRCARDRFSSVSRAAPLHVSLRGTEPKVPRRAFTSLPRAARPSEGRNAREGLWPEHAPLRKINLRFTIYEYD